MTEKTSQRVAQALDQMDALLDPKNQLLAVTQSSATAVGSRQDMAIIRARLAKLEALELRTCEAQLFMSELLDSVETLSAIVEEHGATTLADLMYLQEAILDGSHIDAHVGQSKVFEVVSQLPSGKRWEHFVKRERPGFTLVQVCADWVPDELDLPAYFNGQRWNGWVMPYFSFETAQILVQLMPDLSYDSERDAFIVRADEGQDEDGVYESETLVIDGVPVKTYAIGAGFWCWELSSKTGVKPTAS